jgi:hypothetical protein
MAIKLQRVNPFDVRESVVDFFWRMRAWPLATKDEYFRCWDWRYSAIPESDPTIWIAVDDQVIVGHVACNIRRLRYDGRVVRAGVPGNFLVDPNYRNSMIGPQLASAPIKLAQRGEIDIFIGYSNQIAHAIALGLGCRELGRMRPLVEIRRWEPLLARLPGGGLLAPMADAAVGVWRAVTGRPRPRPANGLSARDLSAAEIASMDRSHWSRSAAFSWDGDSAYLARRFLDCPIRRYRVLGIVDTQSAQIQGFVVGEGSARFNVIHCAVNESVLSEVEAVEVALRAAPSVEVAIVPLLPGTQLAHEFSRAGYMLRSAKRSDVVLRNTAWSSYWQPTHPLAPFFADTQRWKIWYGWNCH